MCANGRAGMSNHPYTEKIEQNRQAFEQEFGRLLRYAEPE